MVILEGSLTTNESDQFIGEKSFNSPTKLFHDSILSLYYL